MLLLALGRECSQDRLLSPQCTVSQLGVQVSVQWCLLVWGQWHFHLSKRPHMCSSKHRWQMEVTRKDRHWEEYCYQVWVFLEVLGRLWHRTIHGNGNRIATIILLIAESILYLIFQRAIVQFAEDAISTFVTQEAWCCVIQIRNVVTMQWKQIAISCVHMWLTWIAGTVEFGSLMQPLLIRCPILTLTQARQCDISFVDPTSPGIASAHTGSASCWGAASGTGSTHSRGRVNVFIHLTDCRNGAIHWHCLSRRILIHCLVQ